MTNYEEALAWIESLKMLPEKGEVWYWSPERVLAVAQVYAALAVADAMSGRRE